VAWKDELALARDEAIAKMREVIADPARADYSLNGKSVTRSAYVKALLDIVKGNTELIGDGFEWFEEHTAAL
jgi:hypothetical protein